MNDSLTVCSLRLLSVSADVILDLPHLGKSTQMWTSQKHPEKLYETQT